MMMVMVLVKELKQIRVAQTIRSSALFVPTKNDVQAVVWDSNDGNECKEFRPRILCKTRRSH
jgi:hypothetical protein